MMASIPSKHESKTRQGRWIGAALVVSAGVFAAVALFAPRAAIPNRLPALRIDPVAAEAAMAKDLQRARTAPHDRWADELRELHRNVGLGTQRLMVGRGEVRSTLRQAMRRTRSVRQDHGEEGVWAIRAEAVSQLDRALAHEMTSNQRYALLGQLESDLERYHVRSEDGELRAPKLVAWTMFKARWNMISGLEPVAGFEPVEVQAYEGWLALHAVGAPETKRFEAAMAYEKSGGSQGSEAVALWAMRLDARPTAEAALRRAYEASPSVRLRNYALAFGVPLD